MIKQNPFESGFDTSSIENLETEIEEIETVEQFADVLEKSKLACEKLTEQRAELSEALGELQNIYNEQLDNKENNLGSKLKELKEALSAWVEMFLLYNEIMKKGVVSVEDDKLLNEKSKILEDYLSKLKESKLEEVDLLAEDFLIVDDNLEDDLELPPSLPEKLELPEGQYIPESGNLDRREWSMDTGLAKVFGISDFGGKGSKYNKVNEDSMFAGEVVDSDGCTVVGVIDGAGGSTMGRLASEIVNKELYQRLVRDGNNNPDLVTAMLETSEVVKKDSKGGYACAVMARINPDSKIELAWSGDSKAMTIRGGKKLDIGTTRMQNIAVEDLLKEGRDLSGFYNHEYGHGITGVLGADSKKPEFLQFQGENEDQIIMASDGLWDVVSEHEVVELSKKYKGEQLRQQLFNLAFERNNSKKDFTIEYDPNKKIPMRPKFGSGDNITIQVAEIKLPENKKRSLKNWLGSVFNFGL